MGGGWQINDIIILFADGVIQYLYSPACRLIQNHINAKVARLGDSIIAPSHANVGTASGKSDFHRQYRVSKNLSSAAFQG